MMTYLIYKLTFPDGKKYIGMSSDLKKRWGHDGCNYRGLKVYDAIKEAGWDNVAKTVLKSGLSYEQACEAEKAYIEMLDSIRNGYNVSRGGKATFDGLHHTEDEKRRISEKLKTRIMTEEHRKHLSESKSGVKHHCAKPVYQYSRAGEFIKKWDYMNAAAKELQIAKTCISQCCYGKRKTAGGYVWAYEGGR